MIKDSISLLSILNLILRVDDYFETFILNKIHQIIIIHDVILWTSRNKRITESNFRIRTKITNFPEYLNQLLSSHNLVREIFRLPSSAFFFQPYLILGRKTGVAYVFHFFKKQIWLLENGYGYVGWIGIVRKRSRDLAYVYMAQDGTTVFRSDSTLRIVFK